MKKALLLLLCLCSLLSAATETCIADISGDGSAHAISTSGFALSITIVALSNNATTNCSSSAVSGCPRVGDSTVSTSKGTPMQPGSSKFYAPIMPFNSSLYALAQIFYVVQSGDKISICYVQ